MRHALVASLLALAVLGAATGRTDAASPPLTRVTVIGDSIAGVIDYEVAARDILARGVDLDLQLAVCRRLVGTSCPYQGVTPPTLVDLLPSIQPGSTVVVAVGYNDFEATFPASVDTTLQALEKTGAQHILWLTYRAERQSYLNMNDDIRAAAARHPELTVVDWNLYSRSHPDWFQPDGLHLTSTGATAMATLVHRALDELGVVAQPAPVRRTLQIVTRTLPTARVGRLYGARLTASGGARPVSWARAGGVIPVGLHLSATGRLTGTPRLAGRRLITLRVTDPSGRSAIRRFALKVAPPATAASAKPRA